MPIRARSTLLLDLDGTLVDPSPGILGCYRHALASFGVILLETEDLRWVIGPSIREGLRQLLDGRADTEEAVRRFRERYSEWGLYQATVYPGILQALAGHRARGTSRVLYIAAVLRSTTAALAKAVPIPPSLTSKLMG